MEENMGGMMTSTNEIKVYALRKVGEMLKASERNNGSIRRGTEMEPRGQIPTLSELGIDKKISSLAQRIAELPDDKLTIRAGAGCDEQRGGGCEATGESEKSLPFGAVLAWRE